MGLFLTINSVIGDGTKITSIHRCFAPPEQRSKEEVVPTESYMNKISGSQTTETCSRRTIILLDNLGVGERNPEENGERHNHRSSADNGSSHNIRFKLGESERRSTLVNCVVELR